MLFSVDMADQVSSLAGGKPFTARMYCQEGDGNLVEDADAVNFVPAGIGAGLWPEAGGDDHVLFRFPQDLIAALVEGVVPDLLGWYDGCT